MLAFTARPKSAVVLCWGGWPAITRTRPARRIASGGGELVSANQSATRCSDPPRSRNDDQEEHGSGGRCSLPHVRIVEPHGSQGSRT